MQLRFFLGVFVYFGAFAESMTCNTIHRDSFKPRPGTGQTSPTPKLSSRTHRRASS